jgi:hypothetical protein
LIEQLAEHGVDASAEQLSSVFEKIVVDAARGFVLLARENGQLVGIASRQPLQIPRARARERELGPLSRFPDRTGPNPVQRIANPVFQLGTPRSLTSC